MKASTNNGDPDLAAAQRNAGSQPEHDQDSDPPRTPVI